MNKRFKKSILLLLIITLGVMTAAAEISFAAQPAVDLGTTSTFGVLAGQTITNTGSTIIGGSAGGDIGLFPGSSFPGESQVTHSGTVHLADSVASQAKDDLVTAYNDAAGRTPVTTIPTELGGQTLTPGVYDSSSGTFQITGTLTLDAQNDPDAVFIFKTASTLITASSSTVSLINGAVPCGVYWQVGSSATLGTNSNFVGHVFALTSITAQTGATIRGQLLARNGSVTLDTNTITNNICVAGPAINVTVSASPTTLTGPGSVTYTYLISNPGTVDLSDVSVTDNKVDSVTYVSGDLNNDNLIQPNEIWKYTGRITLSSTTTNTATTRAIGSETTVTDTASTRVVVSSAPGRSTSGGTGSGSTSSSGTVSGGKLPSTASPWYNLLLTGIALTFIGALGWLKSAKKIHG